MQTGDMMNTSMSRRNFLATITALSLPAIDSSPLQAFEPISKDENLRDEQRAFDKAQEFIRNLSEKAKNGELDERLERNTSGLASDSLNALASDYAIENIDAKTLITIASLIVSKDDTLQTDTLACLRKHGRATDVCADLCRSLFEEESTRIPALQLTTALSPDTVAASFQKEIVTSLSMGGGLEYFYANGALMHIMNAPGAPPIATVDRSRRYVASILEEVKDTKMEKPVVRAIGTFGPSANILVPVLIDRIKEGPFTQNGIVRAASFTIARLNPTEEQVDAFYKLCSLPDIPSVRFPSQNILIALSGSQAAQPNLYSPEVFIKQALRSLEKEQRDDYPIGNNVLMKFSSHADIIVPQLEEMVKSGKLSPHHDIDNLIFQLSRDR